ncbi:MAG: efflux RND transporter periplasmic adaptor subunit [Verrucomicrobiota bacterium]
MTAKKLFILPLIALALAFTFAGCKKSDSAKAGQKYHCPMHPTVVQDKKGSCPICGMDLVPIKGDKPSGKAAAPAEDEKIAQVKVGQFYCPMAAEHVQEEPGKCPLCGMKLVEKKLQATASAAPVPGLTTVAITTETRQRMGLKLGTVEKRALTGAVRTSARIVANETRQHRVTTKIEGWVDKLFVATTGQAIKKGDPLLTVYSPDLFAAQAEYLIALAGVKTLGGSNAVVQQGSDSLLAASRRRFELWDISDEQIERLEKSGKAEKYLTLSAPASGWVTERMVLAGQKIMPGEPLMVISDLTEIWADADIYQSDLPHVKVGMPVQVTLPYWPGQVFTGQVSFITPTLNPMTRTLNARLEIHNPNLLLKPEMYATATLQLEHGEKLAVPTTAVLFTGTRNVAFRDVGDGHLAPAELKLGARSGDYYEVLEGLSEGDKVVVSANFLVDSESSMKAALESLMKGGGSGAEAQPGHAGH